MIRHPHSPKDAVQRAQVRSGDNTGKWILQFRLTLVNPKNCGCTKDQVSVTAMMILDPAAKPVPGSFQVPDPNQ